MICDRYVYPQELFEQDGPGPTVYWTCARTRPRCEKKLARWLQSHEIPFFLPTFQRRTVSHRRVRTTDLPLFPGYIFITGDRNKVDFVEAQSVTDVLKPKCDHQIDRLHADVWNLWKGLANGSHLELARRITPGQNVEVVSGPLKGVEGRFVRWATGNRLLLTIEMLSMVVSLEVPESCTVVPI